VDTGGSEGVHGDPGRDRAVGAHRIAHGLEGFEPEPGAILQRSAVAVRPLVVEGREELHREVRVRPVHVDDVEAAIAAADRSLRPSALHALDVSCLHLLGNHVRLEIAGELARRDRRHPRLVVRDVRPAVIELEPRECPVLVGGVGHQPQGAHVVLVPEARGDQRRLVGVRRERGVLGAHGGPAALGLDAAMRGLRPRLLGPEAGAMGHLIEAVPERLRSDPDPFEQDLVVRIQRISSSRLLFAGR
jgi:hypothetical protein